MLQPTVFQSQLLINHGICFLFPYHVKWRIFRIFILLSLNLINDANKVRNKDTDYYNKVNDANKGIQYTDYYNT